MQKPDRLIATIGLAALALILLAESMLIVATYRDADADHDPPSRWSDTMREVFGRK